MAHRADVGCGRDAAGLHPRDGRRSDARCERCARGGGMARDPAPATARRGDGVPAIGRRLAHPQPVHAAQRHRRVHGESAERGRPRERHPDAEDGARELRSAEPGGGREPEVRRVRGGRGEREAVQLRERGHGAPRHRHRQPIAGNRRVLVEQPAHLGRERQRRRRRVPDREGGPGRPATGRRGRPPDREVHRATAAPQRGRCVHGPALVQRARDDRGRRSARARAERNERDDHRGQDEQGPGGQGPGPICGR